MIEFWFPAIVSILYAITGAVSAYKGNYMFAGTWCCYAAANLFLIFAQKATQQ